VRAVARTPNHHNVYVVLLDDAVKPVRKVIQQGAGK
jgi:hypothetical protein